MIFWTAWQVLPDMNHTEYGKHNEISATALVTLLYNLIIKSTKIYIVSSSKWQRFNQTTLSDYC